MSRTVSSYVRNRTAFYDRAERLTPFLGTRAGRGLFIVRTRDKHIGRSLFSKEGRGEMHVLARAVTVLRALLGDQAIENRTFIDVGANIGTTTVPAILDQGFARVVALEPEEENFVTLRANTVLNEIDDRVVALCKAASNRAGTSELVVNREQGGKHWIASEATKKSRATESDEILRVETVTLDQLADDEVLDPDLTGMLWMDAQGHEGHVLEGALALTSRGVPIVLEWDPRALDLAGGRTIVEDVAERDYTHFAGMRADPRGDGPKFWLRPADELHEYAERFLDPELPESFTDVLLLRLSDDQLPEHGDFEHLIDLEVVIKRQAAGQEKPMVDLDDLDPVERRREVHRRTSRKRTKVRQAKAERAKVKAKRAQEKGGRGSSGGNPPKAQG